MPNLSILPHLERIHQVTLTQSFLLGSYEVTQEQYTRVMAENPSDNRGLNNPVERVSGEDAVEFFHRLSDLPKEKAAGTFIVHRLKQNGNTHVELGLRRNIVLAMTSQSVLITRSFVVILKVSHNRLARKKRTHGGCTTCMGTCQSGAWIGTVNTLGFWLLIRQGLATVSIA